MSHYSLPRSGILSFLDDEGRDLLAGYGSIISTGPGQVVIREGETHTQLYVVIEGMYTIVTEASGTEVHLDTVGFGDCLGEVALFNPDKASATVKSVEEGRLWTIRADALQEFLTTYPSYGCAAILGIDVILSRRLKRANSTIRFHEIVPGFISVRSKRRAETSKLR